MSSNVGNHPLPAPPGPQQFQQQRPAQQRQRAKSGFSFRSNSSHGRNGSIGKIDHNETHEEKESRRLHTKADPSMALSEAEPSAVAREKSSLAPIRSIQHRDGQGNLISDPDRSNPTRNRWERPLDTIRSFEAAIDGNYQRQSYMRPEPAESVANYNQRSSYYGGTQVTIDERPKYSQNGYYGRAQSYRPESAYHQDWKANGGMRPDAQYNGPDNGGPSNGHHPNRVRYPRTTSDAQFAGQGFYPGPGAQHSYETVNTASGSGSSAEAAGYETNPSSENSSVDRIAPLPPKESVNSYGYNGFGGNSDYQSPVNRLNEQSAFNGPNPAQRQGHGYAGQIQTQNQPPVPRKVSTGPRVPIKLGKTNSSGQQPREAQRPAVNEKRKSWFGKRFSRAG